MLLFANAGDQLQLLWLLNGLGDGHCVMMFVSGGRTGKYLPCVPSSCCIAGVYVEVSVRLVFSESRGIPLSVVGSFHGSND